MAAGLSIIQSKRVGLGLTRRLVRLTVGITIQGSAGAFHASRTGHQWTHRYYNLRPLPFAREDASGVLLAGLVVSQSPGSGTGHRSHPLRAPRRPGLLP